MGRTGVREKREQDLHLLLLRLVWAIHPKRVEAEVARYVRRRCETFGTVEGVEL